MGNTHHQGLPIKTAVISGGAVGAHTVAGIEYGTRPVYRDALLSVLHFKDVSPDGVLSGDYAFASQGAATIAVTGVAQWLCANLRHYASLAGNLTLAAPSTATIGAAKFGAWRVLLSDLGALATQAANATTMQFANAEDALLNLAAIAPTANTTTIGYLVLQNGSGRGLHDQLDEHQCCVDDLDVLLRAWSS